MKSNIMFVGSEIPQALDESKQMYYFSQMQKGSEEAREKLISSNIRLVIAIVKRFRCFNYDMDELVSVGILGLISAIDTYNMDLKVNFSTYATSCINNAISTYMKKEGKRKYMASLEDAIDNNKGDIFLKDAISSQGRDFTDVYEEREVINKILELIECLPYRKKYIIKLYYGLYDGKCYKQVELSHILGVSKQYISSVITKEMTKIKAELQRQGFIECSQPKIKGKKL